MTLTSIDLLDLFTRLFDSFMYVIFYTVIFNRKYGKAVTAFGIITSGLISFAAIIITTYYLKNTVANDIISYILYIIIFFSYCIMFLKGEKIIKFIIVIFSLATYSIFNLTALIWIYFNLNLITTVPISLIPQNGFFKIHLIVLSHILIILTFQLIVQKIARKKFSISQNEIAVFIVIPILIEILLNCCILIFVVKKDNKKLVVVLSLIILIIIVIAIIYGAMFSRIRKNYRIKTDYILTQQKMNLYEESVIKSGKQIEKMSKIKHDMKNYLLSIGSLISNKNYEEAKKLCTEMSDNLQSVSVPINTKNILLNAIINVELDKAESEAINFEIKILDSLSEFSGNSEITWIIGNICDNAISYLKTQPREHRIMSLEIANINDTVIIVCMNKITEAMNENNININTLSDICKKYNGNISYKEDNGYYIVKISLNKVNN